MILGVAKAKTLIAHSKFRDFKSLIHTKLSMHIWHFIRIEWSSAHLKIMRTYFSNVAFLSLNY